MRTIERHRVLHKFLLIGTALSCGILAPFHPRICLTVGLFSSLLFFFIHRTTWRYPLGDWRNHFVRSIAYSIILFVVFTLIISPAILHIKGAATLNVWIPQNLERWILSPIYTVGMTIGEEIVFRWLIFSCAVNLWDPSNKSWYLPGICSSLIYGASYWDQGGSSYLIMFLLGLVLTWMMLASKNLIFVILTHLFFKLLTILWWHLTLDGITHHLTHF